MNNSLTPKILVALASIIMAIIFLVPTLKKVYSNKYDNSDFTVKEAKDWITKPISLGLDLSGGVYLVYKVESDEAVSGRLQTTASAIRNVMRKNKVAVTKASLNAKNEIVVKLLSTRTKEKAQQIIADEYPALQIVENSGTTETELFYSITPEEKKESKWQVSNSRLKL